MKLLKITTVLLFVLTSLVSCKKDWACECSLFTSEGVFISDDDDLIINDEKKEDAAKTCDLKEEVLTTTNIIYSCRLVEK